MRAVPRLVSVTLAFALQLRKITENLNQGSRKSADGRPLYLKAQSLPRCEHFQLGYKNQSVYAVSGTSRCLFWDKYKTHKRSVGRAHSCWMLNL